MHHPRLASGTTAARPNVQPLQASHQGATSPGQGHDHSYESVSLIRQASLMRAARHSRVWGGTGVTATMRSDAGLPCEIRDSDTFGVLGRWRSQRKVSWEFSPGGRLPPSATAARVCVIERAYCNRITILAGCDPCYAQAADSSGACRVMSTEDSIWTSKSFLTVFSADFNVRKIREVSSWNVSW